ncbi:MAG: hypothetical protein ACREBF_02885, partial [Candidatus Micrarchaeales archaeon]
MESVLEFDFGDKTMEESDSKANAIYVAFSATVGMINKLTSALLLSEVNHPTSQAMRHLKTISKGDLLVQGMANRYAPCRETLYLNTHPECNLFMKNGA